VILLSGPRIFLITVVVLCLVLSIPGAWGLADTVTRENKEVIFNITSPEQDDVIYFDVYPGYLYVNGQILGSNIQNVTVTYGNETKTCSNSFGSIVFISCQFLADTNLHSIVITVTDSQNSTIADTRNFTMIASLFGPGTIWVSGYVTDKNGNPLKDALLSFENTENSWLANTTTDMNGRYSMKKTDGFHQKITATKAGYQTLTQEVTFEPLTNEQNFTLTREGQNSLSLNFSTLLIAVCIGIGVFALRPKNS
jgi:hypothetical protein